MKFVKRRDGSLVKFDGKRILYAIERAFFEVRPDEINRARLVYKKVLEAMKGFDVLSVDEIQDIIEKCLMEFPDVQLAYRDYRTKKDEVRRFMKSLGISDVKLTMNAITVLKERYLARDANGKIIETPGELFKRVAKTIAKNDKAEYEEKFYNMMARLEFLPNSPTLFNAGRELGQLSACFVLPVHDSLESIFEAVKRTAIIEQSGGGVGFDFSELRPKGDIVKSTKGVASGPVSFMRVFDVATDVIKAGGRRRGAMMGVLAVNHPDIFDFIEAKRESSYLTNFNISVGITDKFMDAVAEGGAFELVNPRDGSIVRKVSARDIWKRIVKSAWETGDPGLLFIDTINKRNPTPKLGMIRATNPCGEVPLYPYESCNLGSINLVRMLRREGERHVFDWDKFRETIALAVRFLDNLIDVNNYPYPEIEKTTKANRKIGLGVMGFADMLALLKIPYDSAAALRLGEKIAKFLYDISHSASEQLGLERGSFPNFKESIWSERYSAMRNATTTVIAPTGSISIIAGVSSGIEPIFAVAFVRNILGGKRLLEINPVFERYAKEYGFYSTKLMLRIARTGSIQDISEVPKDIRRIFKTAHEIPYAQHIKVQASFQKYVDNSVSKTINLPAGASQKDVERAFKLAYKLGCKGITIYRYGSKPEQVLSFVAPKKYLLAHAEYAGGCPTGKCPMP